MEISTKDKYKICMVGWSVIILFFTLSPNPLDSQSFFDIPHLDKLAHFSMFTVLGGILVHAFWPIKQAVKWLWAFSYCLSLATCTEFFQTFIPSRSGDLNDFLANLGGIIVGSTIISYINYRQEARI